jgi:hypothetical protein
MGQRSADLHTETERFARGRFSGVAQAKSLRPPGRKGNRDVRAHGCEEAQRPEEGEDEQTRLFGFRTAYVFDESQTDGEPLPSFATVKGDPMEFTATLETLIGERGITLEYTDRIAPAKGMSSGGRIEVHPGLPPAEQFSVLVHELAHELIHKGERRKPCQAHPRTGCGQRTNTDFRGAITEADTTLD